MIADLNEEASAELLDELGDGALFAKTDITSDESVQEAIDLCRRSFGGIDGAINCAGVAPGEKIIGKSGVHASSSFSNTIRINLLGSFNVLRLAAAAMVDNEPDESGERGIVINTASIAAFEGQIGQVAYSASKAGVVGMTLPAARELARFGIRVMTIAPGVFETPMVQRMPDEVKKSLGSAVPFPSRLGKPAEFAELAIHIIENSMLNGEVIRLDGAVRMGSK